MGLKVSVGTNLFIEVKNKKRHHEFLGGGAMNPTHDQQRNLHLLARGIYSPKLSGRDLRFIQLLKGIGLPLY